MKNCLVFIVLINASLSVKSQALNANAGADQMICLGNSIAIGGTPTATGGTSPYTYSWVPATGLNNPALANPTSTPLASTTYTLFVRDGAGNMDSDFVNVFIDPVSYATAGNDTAICIGDTILGGTSANITGGGISYSWQPATDISNVTAPRPFIYPVITTTYTLTITSPNCGTKIETVTITVNPLPTVSAGPDITIYEGQTAVLLGSGGTQYYWTPFYYMTYQNTANPNVEPPNTTTYFVAAVDANGCINYDFMILTVIPDDSLYFYNTFTPNNDANNDTWFVGNIYKYPNNSIKIFNRYGKIVFQESPYQGLWDGREFGNELPAATYYYIFDPGDGKEKIYGSVTIIR